MRTRGATAAEETLERVCPLPAPRPAVALRLTVRLEAPGDPCFPLSIALRFDYDAGDAALPEAAQDILDRRLYDGLHAGVEAALPQLPPDGLRVSVPALGADPPLARALTPDDARALEQVGAALEALAREAVERAWRKLDEAGGTAARRP